MPHKGETQSKGKIYTINRLWRSRGRKEV